MTNSLASAKLGLSISMHTEELEAIRAIKSFLNYHPDSEIKLWGNSDVELEKVGAALGLQVKKSPKYVDKLMALLQSKEEKSPEIAAEILREFLRCALEVYTSMTVEFVVYMHPDHLMVRELKRSKLKFDLEIHKVNPYSERQLEAWEKATGKRLRLDSYGLAGYFRRKSLIEALDFLLDPEKINLELLMANDLDFIFEDLIIPCAFDALGFKIRDQNITQEIRRRRRLSSFFARPVLLHQVARFK